MVARIRISSDEPAEYEFSNEQRRIRFGRNRERCDVIFDPDDTRVSREHFSLSYEGGSYRLHTNGRNPVFVDGESVVENYRLPDRVMLQVGTDGPLVEFEHVRSEASDLPATMIDPVRPGQAIDAIRAVKRKSLWNRAGLVVALALFAGVAYWSYSAYTHDKSETKTEFAKQRETMAQQGLRIAEQAAELDKAKWSVGQVIDKAYNLERQVSKLQPVLEGHLREIRRSVFVVFVESNSGASPIGTAWAVTENALATNAHVAVAAQELADSSDLDSPRIRVRSPGPNPITYDIARTLVHPGFAEGQRLWEEVSPTDETLAGAETISQRMAFCDVAVLEIELGDVAMPPLTPLALATDAELYALNTQDPLGFVGYPMENQAKFPLKSPTPASHSGYVVALTDYFLSSTTPERSVLIHNSLPAAGGASGSPIINRAGKVVALLSATSLVSVDGTRVSTGSGVSFGQRVDVLREVLEHRDDLDALAGTHIDEWQQTMNSYWRPKQRVLSDHREATFELFVATWREAKGIAASESVDHRTLATESHDSGIGTREIELALTAGQYFAVAISTDGETDIDMLVGEVRAKGELLPYGIDKEPDPSPIVAFEVGADAPFKFVILSKDPDTEFEFRLYKDASK